MKRSQLYSCFMPFIRGAKQSEWYIRSWFGILKHAYVKLSQFFTSGENWLFSVCGGNPYKAIQFKTKECYSGGVIFVISTSFQKVLLC